MSTTHTTPIHQALSVTKVQDTAYVSPCGNHALDLNTGVYVLYSLTTSGTLMASRMNYKNQNADAVAFDRWQSSVGRTVPVLIEQSVQGVVVHMTIGQDTYTYVSGFQKAV